MDGILDLITSQLGGGAIETIGQQMGISQEQAQSGVAAALPALLGGLARNATASPEGAASLASALDRDHDGSVLDNVGGLISALGGAQGGGGGALGGLMGALGGGGGGGLGGILGSVLGGSSGATERTVNGAGILGHILGGRQAPVEQAVGSASGLDAGKAAQLMSMLAPLVMGALGRKKKEQGLDAGGLASLLGQESSRIQEQAPALSGLMGLLDSDGDGSVTDDVAKLGAGLLGGLFGKRS